jgi:hypothetical protein
MERQAHHFGRFCEILEIFRALFNNGWFMEYFVAEEKPYKRYMPEEIPINLRDWHYYVRGTDDERQAWTCGSDVAKPVAELLAADERVR